MERNILEGERPQKIHGPKVASAHVGVPGSEQRMQGEHGTEVAGTVLITGSRGSEGLSQPADCYCKITHSASSISASDSDQLQHRRFYIGGF